MQAAQSAPSPLPPLLPPLQVEALCRQHHCYPQLLAICRTLSPRDQPGQPLSSSARLHHYIATMGAEEGAAERDTFAAFVFQVGQVQGMRESAGGEGGGIRGEYQGVQDCLIGLFQATLVPTS